MSTQEPPSPPDENPLPAVHLQISAQVPEGLRLRITVEALPVNGDAQIGSKASTGKVVYIQSAGEQSIGPLEVSLPQLAQPPAATGLARFSAWWARLQARPLALTGILFVLGLAIYLATRLIGLVHFPIYFFTDEAVQTVLASDLVRDHFKNYAGDFLPTFFENGGKYRLGTSVYFQVIPYLLFGESVFVTRATSVLIGFLAPLAVGLTLRDSFKLRYWWSGVLLLSITPAWFLHSRTAFEYPIGVAFYAVFVYFYLRYRQGQPRYLYPALIAGAISFYSYSPMQIVMLVSGGLLLVSDGRYHWEHWKTALGGLLVLALAALPYARFMLAHNQANYASIAALGSYWIQPLTLGEKINLFWAQYTRGLSPAYWFTPNPPELVRHVMKGYGHLLLLSLPLVLVGLVIGIRQVRNPAYRTVLIALLAAPSGAAIVELGVTRALVMVIPVTLLAALGLERILVWLEGRRLPYPAIAVGLFGVLTVINISMLRAALEDGPTWYDNYGMGGMQYGAQQVFTKISTYIQAHSGAKVVYSPDWANGADVLQRFFLPDSSPVRPGSIAGYLNQRQVLDQDTLLVLTPEEYDQAVSSNKFTDIQVEDRLPYPDGRTGFYFVHLQYVANIDSLLAADQAERRKLQAGQVTIDGQPVAVQYSLLDMGSIENMVDGDPNSLGRTYEANPLVVTFTFPEARSLNGLSAIIGSTEMQVTAQLYASDGAEPVTFASRLSGNIDKPEDSFGFGESVLAKTLRLEFLDLHQGEPGHVHIWEIKLR